MDVRIIPRRLRGTVTPPPSKSYAHRFVLAELLAGCDTFSVSPELSDDIRATLSCAEALRRGAFPALDCGESGSTLRFLLPIALALRGGGAFSGRGRLMRRPLTPYFDIFAEKGIEWRQDGDTLIVRGKLPPGEYRLPGDVSSQFVTGLLFALPLLDGDSVIRLTSPLQSAAYVEMTLETLRQSGVKIERPDAQIFRIPGGQRYRAPETPVEADWSQAAFWYAANYLGGAVEIQGLNPRSAQGDRAITELCRTLDRNASSLAEIDVSSIPDLLPPLAVMAAQRRGPTRFTRAGRLRLKESDRLQSVADTLRAFGVASEIGPDFLTVAGGGPRLDAPIVADGANDHRIVMAASVLACVCAAPVIIQGAEAVGKSYPDFFTHYRQLGGQVERLEGQ